jgi:hypothetical protein
MDRLSVGLLAVLMSFAVRAGNPSGGHGGSGASPAAPRASNSASTSAQHTSAVRPSPPENCMRGQCRPQNKTQYGKSPLQRESNICNDAQRRGHNCNGTKRTTAR